MKIPLTNKVSAEPQLQNDFSILKKRIYAMYIMIVKALFTGNSCEVSETDFDTLLAEVCVSQMDDSISYDEFKELSSYLVTTYKVFKLGKDTDL